MPNQSATAFPSTENNLRELIKNIDSGRLKKELVPACSFLSGDCCGMCCSLQVAVTREETQVLTGLVKDKAKTFRQIGLAIRSPITTLDAKTQRNYLAKKRRGFRQLNKIIYNLSAGKNKTPKPDFKLFLKFIRTCVFSLGDGSCALQRISLHEGLHKWYYKPINCWKYPLSIDNGWLTLPGKTNDLHFPCQASQGTPAYLGLKEELSFLGKILNRDIL